MLERILKEIHINGGIPYYVGGYVRDMFIGVSNKDIDIEIYNLTMPELEEILSKFGEVDTMGKKFAILKIRGLDVDFSLPRTEKKIGEGHRGFEIEINPYATTLEASLRRDLTINSILKNAITGEIIDHFNGISDIENKVIRYTNSESFQEDPLRVLRVAQFAARFNFSIDNDTFNLCKVMVSQGQLEELPYERIEEEYNKLLLKGQKPSVGINFLKDIGFINPVLKNLIGCYQSPIHHPEGDVWTHTMMVIDYAATIRDKANDKLAFMYGALCHDVGKPLVTDEEGHSYGHDKAGIEPTEKFMKSITHNTKLISSVSKFTELHMRILQNAFTKKKTIRKLIVKLEDKISFNDLLLLGEADHMGRKGDYDFSDTRNWYELIIQEIGTIPPKKIVTGKDLIYYGLTPGPIFKNILDFAYEMQLEGSTREEILNIIENNYINRKCTNCDGNCGMYDMEESICCFFCKHKSYCKGVCIDIEDDVNDISLLEKCSDFKIEE